MKGKYEAYQLTWHQIGQSDRAAVPLGNGDLASSFWVTQEGLHFYLAKSDALTETDRNVKLGKVNLSMEPNPFSGASAFTQRMEIYDGCVCVEAQGNGVRVRLHVFVDKYSNILYVEGESDRPVRVQVSYDNWRTQKPAPEDDAFGLSAENTDVIESWVEGLLFYHQNGDTCVSETAELEGVGPYLDEVYDSLTGRIFGGFLLLEDGQSRQGVLEAEGSNFTMKAAVLSQQPTSLPDWKTSIVRLAREAATAQTAFGRTKNWWNNYWEQSYVFVQGDVPADPVYEESLAALRKEPVEPDDCPSAVTRAYVHTKYLFACCSTGEFPIPFNGALFNLMPGSGEHYNVDRLSEALTTQPNREPDAALNPDERPWGHCNLWQNLRLPYFSMLARGEYDGMNSLFRHFKRFWPIDRRRQSVYYGGEGQYSNELTTSFGLMPAGGYGLDRSSLAPGYAVTRFSAAVDISPGLELATLMLDYYDYTRDGEFLRGTLLPYTYELLRGIETRFTVRENGKMVLSPLHCVETFHDTKNPLTVVAGLYAVTQRLLKLPQLPSRMEMYLREYRTILPDIPIENPDKPRYAPAQEYGRPMNVEPVWITPVFPFRLSTWISGDSEIARNSYHYCMKERADAFRPFKLGSTPSYTSYSGWQYGGMAAALLGMSDDAAQVLRDNCALSNPGHKYPAMWGPCYDGVPDVDHGANLLTTLQLMLLQTQGDAIYLFPAWERNWDVSFRLFAPQNTIISCTYRKGKVESLSVDPPQRRQDIVICL